MVALSLIFESMYEPEPIFSGLNLFELFDGKNSKLLESIKSSSSLANLVFAGLLSPMS